MASTALPLSVFEGSAEEWHARVELAALYRLFVHYGWTDMIYTHLSARVPNEPDCYLINPFGYLFEEITASSLLKVSFDGKVVSGGTAYNEAGHLIHTAALKARPEINFVLHSHTRAGMAVSAMKDGLLPLTQHAMIVLSQVGYHDYAVVTSDAEECERIGRDLGDLYLLMLRNHGLLACGRTAAEAFQYHYYLEMACKAQVDILASGQACVWPSDEAAEVLKNWSSDRKEPWGQLAWPGLLRMLDRKDPDYKT